MKYYIYILLLFLFYHVNVNAKDFYKVNENNILLPSELIQIVCDVNLSIEKRIAAIQLVSKYKYQLSHIDLNKLMDYLGKPPSDINTELLLAICDTIFNSGGYSPEFRDKLLKIIYKNLDKPNYSVRLLAYIYSNPPYILDKKKSYSEYDYSKLSFIYREEHDFCKQSFFELYNCFNKDRATLFYLLKYLPDCFYSCDAYLNDKQLLEIESYALNQTLQLNFKESLIFYANFYSMYSESELASFYYHLTDEQRYKFLNKIFNNSNDSDEKEKVLKLINLFTFNNFTSIKQANLWWSKEGNHYSLAKDLINKIIEAKLNNDLEEEAFWCVDDMLSDKECNLTKKQIVNLRELLFNKKIHSDKKEMILMLLISSDSAETIDKTEIFKELQEKFEELDQITKKVFLSSFPDSFLFTSPFSSFLIKLIKSKKSNFDIKVNALLVLSKVSDKKKKIARMINKFYSKYNAKLTRSQRIILCHALVRITNKHRMRLSKNIKPFDPHKIFNKYIQNLFDINAEAWEKAIDAMPEDK